MTLPSLPRSSCATPRPARDGRPIWSDATLRIEPGEFVAVLGPNGAGKSTLLRVLLGLLPLSAGTVVRPRRLTRRPRSGEIGYLPQRHGFDATTRIRGVDLVRLGLDGDRWGLPLPGGPARASAVDEVIELVGATDYARAADRRVLGRRAAAAPDRRRRSSARRGCCCSTSRSTASTCRTRAAVAALLDRICRASRDHRAARRPRRQPAAPLRSTGSSTSPAAASSPARPSEVITSETLSALYGVPVEVLRTSDGRLVVVGQPEAPAHHSDRHHHP